MIVIRHEGDTSCAVLAPSTSHPSFFVLYLDVEQSLVDSLIVVNKSHPPAVRVKLAVYVQSSVQAEFEAVLILVLATNAQCQQNGSEQYFLKRNVACSWKLV